MEREDAENFSIKKQSTNLASVVNDGNNNLDLPKVIEVPDNDR